MFPLGCRLSGELPGATAGEVGRSQQELWVAIPVGRHQLQRHAGGRFGQSLLALVADGLVRRASAHAAAWHSSARGVSCAAPPSHLSPICTQHARNARVTRGRIARAAVHAWIVKRFGCIWHGLSVYCAHSCSHNAARQCRWLCCHQMRISRWRTCALTQYMSLEASSIGPSRSIAQPCTHQSMAFRCAHALQRRDTTPYQSTPLKQYVGQHQRQFVRQCAAGGTA